MKVLIDFETYCDLNLKAKPSPGVWGYAEHPSCEILCMAYKIDDDSTELWTPPEPFPLPVLVAIELGATFEAHNAQFEIAIWKNLLKDRTHTQFYGETYSLGALVPMPTRWRDTMAACAYRALPMGLGDVGDVLDLESRKSKDGEDVLRKLSRPRKPTKADPRTRYPMADAEYDGIWQRLYDYCKQDVETEHALAKRLGWLPPEESSVWALDQNINLRGVCLDISAITAARRVADELDEKLTQELCRLVGDPQMTGKRVAKFREWLKARGVQLDDMKKETVEATLADMRRHQQYDPEAYRALEIRQQTSISSVAKLDAMLHAVSKDGRLRGSMQYHGSGTGRWAGRIVQPQNLPRPTATNVVEGYDKEGRPKKGLCMDMLVRDLKRYDYEMIDFVYGDVGSALTSSLRGMIVADKGKRLYVSDFSAIEARVTMWLAGQDDKVAAFEAYDRKEGPDIYCIAAQDLYQKPINKNDHPIERQLGKVQVLGCGYQMSGPKLKDTAAKQGVDLTEESAKWLVQNYREKNYMVPRLWYGLQDAAVAAIADGAVTEFRGIEYRTFKDAAGPWLTCKLPSGRKLWYYHPVLTVEEDWQGRPRQRIGYWGRDNKKAGAWGQVRTYGGMLTENVVQAISRDLLVAAMYRVEAAGYPIVLHVHDELISETDETFGSVPEYDALVAGPTPPWAKGLPVAAEGWTGLRYRKG